MTGVGRSGRMTAKGDILLNNGQLALAFGGPVSDAQLTNLISGQGRFNISLRWFGPGDFDRRPTVVTPDPRVVLAGDGIRVDLPVALMERAATTGAAG